MGDKKYVKLKPAKMGCKYRGMLPPKRQSLLIDALETLKTQMGTHWDSRLASKEIFWLNIWQDEDDVDGESDMMEILDAKISKAIGKWSRKAARKYCEREAILDAYGFVVNPMGSSTYQPWHVDYTTDAAVVWIPMTPFTDKNAMQYVTLPSNTPKKVLQEVASDVDGFDFDALTREVDYLLVNQVVAKPMSVFYMGRGTIHRGIPNTENDHRIAFFISVHFIKDYETNYPYEEGGEAESGVATFGK